GMDSVRSTEAISRMEIWSSRTNAVRSAASTRSCSRSARRIFASSDQGRAGNWIGSGSGMEVVLLDESDEVLYLVGGDVGEGEGLDLAGTAGGGVGDGAAVLQRAGEGNTCA